MSSNERLAIVLAVLLVISLIPWRLILWRMVGRSARKTLIIVTLVVITWGLGNSLTRWDRTFPGWFFATNNEFAFGAMMSSLMLILAGVAALLNAIIPRQIDPGAASSAPTLPSPALRGKGRGWGLGGEGRRLPWLLMAVSFLFMGLDEYYSIHEASDIWNTIYPFNGVILVLLGVVIYVQERDFVVPFFLVIGVGMIGFGGVILDEFSNEVPLSLGIVTLSCTYKIQGIFCTDLSIVEELFELAGGGMALVGFVAYAEKHQTLPRWKLTRWAVTGFAAFWVLWMVSHTWLVPTITARIQADPVIVEYMNGALELQSYRLSQNVAAPGDTVDVTLYFRAGEVLTEDYYLSVHLLAHPDVKSMAQADTQLGDYDYPTSAWLPLVSVKSVITLKLPKNLPTPASYWVMVRVWQGPDLTHHADEPITPESEGPRIPVTNTDRQLLAPDTVVVAALPVLGDPPDSQPPTASDYRFNNSIRLDGYDLPTSGTPGQEITLRFWWKTSREINQELTQFLHFYPAAGDDDFYTFDGEPFGGSFPFADWPDGLDVVDTRLITLPADMPPGEYRVHTGIYDPVTGQRVPITDANGDPVPDNSIALGTFTVTP